MKKQLLLLIGLALTAWGNGGGYHRGGVEGSGDLRGFEPEETEKVQMAEELLRVSFHQDFAEVEIRYLLRNRSDGAAKVRFGFPVEESRDRDAFEDGSLGGIAESEQDELNYCEGYRIESDGRELEATWEGETRRGEDQRFDTIAGWMISELRFAEGQEREVKITFRSHYPVHGWSVSDDEHEKAIRFRYRLSTAAVWGGPIGKGRIELIPAGVDPAELRVIKPVNRFRRDGDKWVWEFEGLEPTMADDLEIEVAPELKRYMRPVNGDGMDASDWVSYVGRGERWIMEHANYEVRASSTLADDRGISYAADNLKDWDKAWSEGAAGSGVGEWLEFEPKVAKPLQAIRIWPGYGKTAELFEKNGRPKTLEVLLNDEHRFIAQLRDSPDPQRIPVVDYGKPVEKLRLSFREVFPGSKYEDLCVSKLRLEVGLDSKPEIQPAR